MLIALIIVAAYLFIGWALTRFVFLRGEPDAPLIDAIMFTGLWFPSLIILMLESIALNFGRIMFRVGSLKYKVRRAYGLR